MDSAKHMGGFEHVRLQGLPTRGLALETPFCSYLTWGIYG